MKMKQRRVAIGTLIFCMLSTGGLFAQQNTGFSSVVNGNNAFAFDLYAKLASGKGNIFFSPYSISTALAMTYAGARGKTESQMARVMYFGKDRIGFHKAYGEMQSRINGVQKDGNVKLCVANSLWMQKDYKFLPSFLALTQTNYDAAFNYVDYKKDAEAARVSINTWVEQKTNDKIKDLIGKDALDATTRMVLANAIYFKGSWTQKFDTAMTKEQLFRISSKDSVTVRMMTLYGQEFGYLKDNKVECIRLPYAGNDLSMIIILPNKRDGLHEIESTLTKGQVNGICTNLRKTEVTVCVPKFKITRDFLLNKQLSSLGMTSAFGMSADFSGMDGSKNLFISAVIHKAFVDVNEEGTEAAAATGVVMMTKCMPGTPPMFCADHPFIFFIRDNATGSILFMGRIVNPME